MLRYIARQPILGKNERTFAYELLYRAANEGFARIDNPEQASRSVLDDLVTLGFDELAAGHKVFLNCTHDLLAAGHVKLLPSDKVVVEVLETVEPDDAVLSGCRELKKHGFQIALDDFVLNDASKAFIEFADYIKIDFRATDPDSCARIVDRYGRTIQFLAEKVETREEYNAAVEMGYSFFQGYYFAKPAVMEYKQISPLRVNYVRLLAAICKEDLNFVEIEGILKSDVALCYKLLRYLNSAAFCLYSKITSLKQALTLLGENAIRRWVSVSAVVAVGEGKTTELMMAALLRARFCELLAGPARCSGYEAFLVGLFSLMDALLDMPLEKAIAQVDLPPEAQKALLGNPCRLRELFDLALAYCNADWPAFQQRSDALHISADRVSSDYLQALRWINSIASLI